MCITSDGDRDGSPLPTPTLSARPLLFASTWELRSDPSFPHLSCPSQDDKSPEDLNMVHILGSSLCQTSLFQEDDTPASGKTLSAQNSLIVGFLSMSAPLIRLETILCKLYSLRGMVPGAGEEVGRSGPGRPQPLAQEAGLVPDQFFCSESNPRRSRM